MLHDICGYVYLGILGSSTLAYTETSRLKHQFARTAVYRLGTVWFIRSVFARCRSTVIFFLPSNAESGLDIEEIASRAWVLSVKCQLGWETGDLLEAEAKIIAGAWMALIVARS